MTNNYEKLETYRDKISKIDTLILQLICKRMQLSKNIGILKSEFGIPTESIPQEEKILSRNIRLSKKLQLNENLTFELTNLLIKFSKNIQK
jgi:chorismate mutase